LITLVAVLFVVFLVGKSSVANDSEKGEVAGIDSQRITLYKSPTCGCCLSYVSYLKKEGFDIKVETTNDMNSIKDKYSIPYDKQSCHTMVMGDRFVEGHVPVEAIDKMLADSSDIDGITLPEMPAGSPGMPGIKSGPFEIFSLNDGVSESYMQI